jgi:hypothetical protein
MKSTNLIQLIALPALATANFLDLFIVAEQNMVDVTITGKKDPSEAMQTMDPSTTGFDTNTQCLLDDNTWSRFGCQERTMYRQVGEFNFPRATIDPRPFVIATFPNPNDLQATKQIVGYCSHYSPVDHTDISVQHHCDGRGNLYMGYHLGLLGSELG